MEIFVLLRLLIIFLGGLVAGSFINCVVWRLKQQEIFCLADPIVRNAAIN